MHTPTPIHYSRNALRQTALHCVCQVSQQKSPSALERRSYSVILLLSWRGPQLPNGDRERVDVAAADGLGNTALHYASASGLRKCVEYLVAHGADLFAENAEGRTACDIAIRENHHDIALFLESKMMASCLPDDLRSSAATLSASSGGGGGRGSFEVAEDGGLLRTQDFQEAKDQLIVETADKLNIPLFTAEAILRANEWSRDLLTERFRRDPVETCLHAGVQPPTSVLTGSKPRPASKSHENLLMASSTPLAASKVAKAASIGLKTSTTVESSTIASSKVSATSATTTTTNKSNSPPPPLVPAHQTQQPQPQPPMLPPKNRDQEQPPPPPARLLSVPALKPKIYSENSFIVDEELAEDECLCDLCCDLVDTTAREVEMGCGHKLCSKCWKSYLSHAAASTSRSASLLQSPKDLKVSFLLFIRSFVWRLSCATDHNTLKKVYVVFACE